MVEKNLLVRPRKIRIENFRLDVYKLGSIPNLTVWAGETLAFRIDVEKMLGKIEMTVVPPPAGEILFDSQSGEFSYMPDSTDKISFNLTFSVESRGKTIRQTITITSIPEIRPERDYVSSYPELPDPSSTLYLNITKQLNDDKSEDHLISGMRVIFDKKDDRNNLFKNYHQDPGEKKLPDEPSPEGTFRNLTICADELEIHGELSLPETNVRIFARKLVFKDLDDKPGRIITCPLPYANTQASEKKDGKHGRKAGDIFLAIHEIDFGEKRDFRFNLRGGCGQHAAPGANGEDGRDISKVDNFKYTSHLTCRSPSLTWHFDPPATYIKVKDHIGGPAGAAANTYWGQSTHVPGNGKDATPATLPGNGGEGGNFLVYFPEQNDSWNNIVDNSGGQCGEPGKKCFGGSAGSPTKSAQYRVECWNDTCRKLHRQGNPSITRLTETKRGKDAPAPQAKKSIGETGKKDIKSGSAFENMWLHPSLLKTVLLYVRDAYLISPGRMEQIPILLNEYDTALQSVPISPEFKLLMEQSTVEYDESFYRQTQAEVATLHHRIESQLDYFGNPSGWSPLFTLPVCLQMYNDEVKHSLKTLVLARWIQKQAAKATSIERMADQSIDALNADTDRALEQIEQSKDIIKKLREQAQALEKEISSFTVRLEVKRTELKNKAEQEATEAAWINFGVNTLNAVCQVIPYGQPALGTLGNVGKVIADTAINSEDPLDAVGPITNLLADFGKAKLDSKAAEIIAAAKEKKKDESSDKAEEAASRASELTHIGKTIGPALTSITDSIKGLNVPQSEVDSRLRKLEAESPEFQELVHELEALNVKKANFAQKLNEGLQILSSAYATVTSNLLTISMMEKQRRDALSVLDHDALFFIQNMDQSARMMLLKYLYYLAKSYEYAVLEPIAVNFQLNEIFDKITPLLEGLNIDSDLTKITDDELLPVFNSELRNIEDKLKTNYRQEYERRLTIRLSTDQTPEIISQLNSTGEAIINLRDFNCILPRDENVKLQDVEVQNLEFEDAHSSVSLSGSVDFTLEPMGDGTMRSGNRLFVVRHPTSANSATVGRDSQQIWGVTYHFGVTNTSSGANQMDPIRPSEASLELLDYLMGDTEKSIQMKIAKPAAWTDIKVRYARHFTGAPPLKSVTLKLTLNMLQADDNYCALDVRMSGRYSPLLRCSPDDVNGGRNDGFGSIYRIYPKGTKVELDVSPRYGKKSFTHWVIIDNTDTMEPREAYEHVLVIDKIEHNMLLFCYYEAREDHHAVVSELHPVVRQLFLKRFKTGPGETEVKMSIRSEYKTFVDSLPKHIETGEQKMRHGWSSRILNEPQGFAVGYLPLIAEFTALSMPRQIQGKDWMQIDYKGTVGWVTSV
ncbi:hypothetical protein JXJ21_17360 [candidate division KSB1 bacterium]|nr:hypothetical protein [candidate division KSB1 bacterium]